MVYFYSCFIGDTRVRWGIFLAPLFTVIIFNVIVFILVTRVIIEQGKRTLSKTKGDNDTKRVVYVTLKTMLGIVSVMLMFGLSWLFGALSIDKGASVFQWLFIIFSTLQGFCLFVFFCIIAKDGREEWQKLLTCYRYDKKKHKSLHSSSGKVKTKETPLTGKMASIRRAAAMAKKTKDPESNYTELEMNSSDLTKLVDTKQKEQDSQLPPQVFFRLNRLSYGLIEQNGTAPDFTNAESEMFTNTLNTRSVILNTELSQSEVYSNPNFSDYDSDKEFIS